MKYSDFLIALICFAPDMVLNLLYSETSKQRPLNGSRHWESQEKLKKK